jgi:hypothetical protein
MGDDVRWMGLDHEAIHKMINMGPGPSASGPQAQFWGTLSAGLNDISTKLHDKLNTLKVAWDGQSSESAQAGMSPLKDWASKAETGSEVMKTSFELQGNYVGEARAEVPEPVKVTTPQPSGWQVAGAGLALVTGNAGPAAAVAAQSADHEGQERAKDEAARQAVKAMDKYQTSSTWNADTLGQFDTPPQVVVDTPPPAGNGNINVVQTHGTLNQNSTVQHNTVPTDTNTHAQSTTFPVNTQQQQIHTPPNTPPQTTTPQHVAPPTPIQQFPPTPTPKPPFIPPQPPGGGPGGPGFPGGGPFVPGGYGGTGGPGGGGANSGSGGGRSGFGQGGRGGAGSGFGQNAVDSEGRQLGRGGAAGSGPLQEGLGRGGPGGSNLGGGRGSGGQMGPGGKRANGEDDDEHETPDYLLETEDVFGDERMVAPPVIGEKREQ